MGLVLMSCAFRSRAVTDSLELENILVKNRLVVTVDEPSLGWTTFDNIQVLCIRSKLPETPL